MLGLRHLNLNVSDLERSVSFYAACFGLAQIERSEEAVVEKHGRPQRLRQAGGQIGRAGTREHRGCKEAFAYVSDPDGYAIELATQAALYSCLEDSNAA